MLGGCDWNSASKKCANSNPVKWQVKVNESNQDIYFKISTKQSFSCQSGFEANSDTKKKPQSKKEAVENNADLKKAFDDLSLDYCDWAYSIAVYDANDSLMAELDPRIILPRLSQPRQQVWEQPLNGTAALWLGLSAFGLFVVSFLGALLGVPVAHLVGSSRE